MTTDRRSSEAPARGSRALDVAGAFAAGLVAVPALPPWNLWPLLFVGVGGLYRFLALLPAASVGRAGLIGWSFGLGWFVGGLSWIANALLVPGYPFRWVWPFVIGALPAVLAVFPALACALSVRFFSLRHDSGLLGFVASMAMAEWLRGHLFSGFPWNLYAHVWSTSPALLQTAALGGAWLLSVLTLFWATLPAFLVVRPAAPGGARWVLPAVGVATFVGCLAYGHTRLRRPVEFHPDIALRLVQPNIAQADKSNPQKAAENLAVLLELSAREPASGGVTFVVWPETAVAARTLELPGVRRRIAEALSAHPPDTYLLTGVLRHDEPARGLERYFNSLLVLDRTGATIATYDKSRLVPFAERVPLRSLLDLAPYVNRIASLTPGTGPATIAVHAGVPPFSPAICYEIIFPRAVTSATGARPEWIVNVTNDAWFGDSPGPYQHFVHARFRAVEEGLPVVRVANAGISGVVDPFGRIVAMSGLFTRTALATRLPLAAAPTPYALLGDAPVLGLIVLTAIAAAIRRP